MVPTSSLPTFKLILIQEPTTGSAFEDNLLGRLGLAPPLILELEMTKDGQVQDPSAELPFLICQCTLLREDGSVADMLDRQTATATPAMGSTLMPPPTPSRRRGRRSSSNRRGSSPRPSGSAEAAAGPSATSATHSSSPTLLRMLYGTLVAGAQPSQSLRGGQGEKPYFFFPEISIRTPGRFKIQCRLMRLAL